MRVEDDFKEYVLRFLYNGFFVIFDVLRFRYRIIMIRERGVFVYLFSGIMSRRIIIFFDSGVLFEGLGIFIRFRDGEIF